MDGVGDRGRDFVNGRGRGRGPRGGRGWDSRGGRGGFSRGGRGGFSRGGRGGFSRGAHGSSDSRLDSGSVFSVRRSEHYSGPAPQMEVPRVLGNYSVDEEREIGYDRSTLHFIKKQYLPEYEIKTKINLNEGLEDNVDYTGNQQESFDNFLRWIYKNQDTLRKDGSTERLDLNFVCSRSSLKKIMKTPYEEYKGNIYATEFKGTVYMIYLKNRSDFQPRFEDKSTQWGHIFEHILKAEPRTKCDANPEYRCVLQVAVEDLKILYAPEVDCADPEAYEEDHQDLKAFILTHCCRELNSSDSRKKFNFRKFRMLEWWTDNKLSGIPRILVGFRNDGGIVNTLKLYKTEDLPEICANEWQPDVCLNFLQKFMQFVQKKVREDPNTIYKFEYGSYGSISCTKESDPIHNFLPTWYTKGLFAKDSDEED